MKKKQIHKNVVSWVGELRSLRMEAPTQFFENSLQESRENKEPKAIIIALQLESFER